MHKSRSAVLVTVSALTAVAGLAFAGPDDVRKAKSPAKVRVNVKLAKIGVEVTSADPVFGALRVMDDVNHGEITYDGGTDGIAAFKHLGPPTGSLVFLNSGGQTQLTVPNTGSVSATGFTTTGAVNAGSAAVSGSVTASSVTTTGAVNAASLTTTGGIGTASVTASGDVAADAHTGRAFVASGAQPFLSVSGPNGTFAVTPYFGDQGGTKTLFAYFDAPASAGGTLRFDRPHATPTPDYIDIGDDNTGSFLIDTSASGRAMTVLQSGNIGIGTVTPAFKLEVNGTAGKSGGGAWSVSSDLRLKKNVRAITGALDTLLALRGVKFEYRDPAAIHELSGERIGFIAQEVEKVIPDWVEEVGGWKRLTVRGFEALAVEALREVKSENDSLKAQNAELKRRLDALESGLAGRLEKLEKAAAAAETEMSRAQR